jgi:hypothetical protein
MTFNLQFFLVAFSLFGFYHLLTTSLNWFHPFLSHFFHFVHFDRLSIQHTVCGLSPQLVCLLFHMVSPPIHPVGLTNGFDRKIGILTDFTGLSPSPKFGLFGPNLSMPVVGEEGNLNFYLAAVDFDSLAFAASPRLVEAR